MMQRKYCRRLCLLSIGILLASSFISCKKVTSLDYDIYTEESENEETETNEKVQEGELSETATDSMESEEQALEQYLTIELPSGLTMEEQQVDLNDFFKGYLFVGDFDEPIHGSVYDSWYYPGGIAVSNREENENLQFEDRKIVHAGIGMNHTERIGDLEQIDGF